MARMNTTMDTLARRPRRPSRKKQARRKTVLAIFALLALFVIVGAALAIRMISYGEAHDEYAAYQAADTDFDVLFVTIMPEQTTPPEGVAAFVSPSPAPSAAATAKPFYSAKVASLRKDNRDAAGWLDIVGTEMQYPVVQGEDNAYYMTHTFKKKKNASGAIFLDCWNAPDFTDFNTVRVRHLHFPRGGQRGFSRADLRHRGAALGVHQSGA